MSDESRLGSLGAKGRHLVPTRWQNGRSSSTATMYAPKGTTRVNAGFSLESCVHDFQPNPSELSIMDEL